MSNENLEKLEALYAQWETLSEEAELNEKAENE